ncbi:ATP-dependent helicase [Actinacidiphila epipremni]|uniref:DNA 3'-5' helicase n=1 Tax=Actinacidiphila epipremni TaxID=2053013 RepID=A0ABX0ZF47_9ACTN|nr:ATP-dependent DNA helicase [Actinacidiphila epipremni]NJP42423.1 UvrD-helicase domain-containing protein [Actinacidiphila epipremni]
MTKPANHVILSPPPAPGPAPAASAATGYRLLRTPPAQARPPVLDADQRAVVEHRDGPLLVLAGPGTGKTATLVEAALARVRDGTPPERVLVLTFGRRAAVDLRDRMAARGLAGMQASTFHSFCYALLREHQSAADFQEPVRLLSGPEQDLLVRELLAGQAALEREGRGRVRWPDDLRAALTTRGFADEVRAVLARTRELGLGPEALDAFAARIGRPDWTAAAAFLDEYLSVTELGGMVDYAELVHRAVLLARRPEVHRELAGRYDAVYVDEYQDTDAAQVRLLRALAGQGRTLVAFGDPDQSVYAFRGSDVNGILGFPEQFRRRDGRPADIRVLRTSRRARAGLLAATRQVAARMPLPRLPAAAVRAHRTPTTDAPGGTVAVRTYPTPGAEVESIADTLRRAHLEDGLPWHAMAVLTRSTAALAPLRRALTSAGVPIDLPPSTTPLHTDPALTPLLLALHLAATSLLPTPAPTSPPEEISAPRGGSAGGSARSGAGESEGSATSPQAEAATPACASASPGTEASTPDPAAVLEPGSAPQGAASPDPAFTSPPEEISAPRRGSAGGSARSHAGESEGSGPPQGEGVDGSRAGGVVVGVEEAIALLGSPLGGMDAADLRRLGRALREEERAAGVAVPRPSDELIAEALSQPERLVAHDASYARGARRVAALLRKARDVLAGGGTAEDALWALWDGTPWAARLERAALRGGPAGRNADRDLDAVCALFETAARAEERTGGRGALNFLEELSHHDIAADTLSGRTVRPDAVPLMTAHRAKGLEWRLVVVAGVQEGVWPDLRRRGSLLEADRIGRDGIAPPLSQGALLAEERRLFYVAATRASERLLVTAVKSAADDGDQPSRFLAELGVPPQDVPHRPRRPLAVAALVAELRATTVDPAASPALRDAAARRLARLAELNDDGHPLVPAAHPDRWWGLYETTASAVPLRDRDQPVALSGSALDQLANTCSLQWFLGREVKAEPPATAAQGFGNVVHVLADEVASGRAPADLDVLMERLDSVWDALAFDAPWKSRQEKDTARAALERFLRWHVMERGRTPVATEHEFDVTLAAGDAQVRIRGSMDRVETDAQGAAYVVDFKTGRAKPTAAEVARHPQLAVYQLAVREGAVDPLFGGAPPPSGGAELVQLRIGAARRDGGETVPAVQRQEPLAGQWAEELLATAAARVLDERFTPAAGQHCTHCAFRASCTARPEGRHVVE